MCFAKEPIARANIDIKTTGLKHIQGTYCCMQFLDIMSLQVLQGGKYYFCKECYFGGWQYHDIKSVSLP